MNPLDPKPRPSLPRPKTHLHEFLAELLKAPWPKVYQDLVSLMNAPRTWRNPHMDSIVLDAEKTAELVSRASNEFEAREK